MGVTRGTDLLLYVLALVLIYLVGSTGVRFREQEARLVRLARQVALAEAEARIGLGVAPGFRGPAQHGHPSGATAATVAADIVVPSGEAGHRVS